MCCATYRSRTLAVAIYNTIATFFIWGLIFWVYNPWTGARYRGNSTDVIFIIVGVFSIIHAYATILLWYGWIQKRVGLLKVWRWINIFLIILEIIGMVATLNLQGILGNFLYGACILIVFKYEEELENESATTFVRMEEGVTPTNRT